MPDFPGRLRTPRLAAAPSSPVVGEEYYDTVKNVLRWWNGTMWVLGGMEVYEQLTQPTTTTVGAIWIEQTPV
jgi:hypothetical protein